jgi:Phage derived protein Gp49-like (DUF891)
VRIAAVIKGDWTVYELLNERGDGLLAGAEPGPDTKRMWAFLAQVAEHGPESFGENRCHHVAADPKIFQFDVTGTLRFLWFYDRGHVVVLVRCFYKEGGKRGKTPPHLIDAAQAVFASYSAAKANNTLDIIEN